MKKNLIDCVTKRWKVFLIFNSVLTGLWGLGLQINYSGDVWGTPEENFVKPLNISTVLCLLFLFFLNAVSLLAVAYIAQLNSWKKGGRKEANENFLDKKTTLYRTSLVLLLIAWMPYLLSYFPGGVYVDTFGVIDMAYGMDDYGMQYLNNHHPILYTLLWRGAILVGRVFDDSLFFAVSVFQIVQYIVMASVIAYLIVWARANGLNKPMTIVMLLFLMFFPLFPLYAISLWKDTLFSLALLLFVIVVADGILKRETNCFTSTKYLLKLMLCGCLVAFLRNNGKYIVFITLFALLGLKVNKLRQHKKMFGSFCALILTISIIQGPIYDEMGFNVDKTTESLGIPMQQISHLVYYDYELTAAEREYIESIVSEKSIKEHYRPCLFDSIKWYAPDYNSGIIDQNFLQFLVYYSKMVTRHRIGAIKAYMLATVGFWAPNITDSTAYVQSYMWDNVYNLENINVLEKIVGVDIRGNVDSMKPISSALFFLLVIYTAFALVVKKNYYKLLILLPAVANWATVMIATPIACSLRYVYILVLLIPIEVVLVYGADVSKNVNTGEYLRIQQKGARCDDGRNCCFNSVF